MELFNMYKTSGSYTEALMVGRNLFNKTPGSVSVFNEYFSLLCSQATDATNTIDDRRQFISQAEVTLAFFSENAELNTGRVEEIKANEARITAIVKTFNKEIDEQNSLAEAKILKKNDERLAILNKLYDRLQKLSDKQEFDKILGQIGAIDNTLVKDVLNEQQQEHYARLTKLCTQVINKKLSFFEREKNVDYNQQAIEAYKRVYDYFKTNDCGNKNHKEILKDFFSFNASRLFNETLVYYNHVYSYILSKMDDDEKFILTKYAIVSEQKED